MQLEIAQSEQTVYKSEWESVESRTVARDSKGIEIGGRLALKLAPGVYELRIAVQLRGAKKTDQRVVLFGVEP